MWSWESSQEVGAYRHFRVRQDLYRSPRDGEARDFFVLDMPDWVQVVAVTGTGRVIVVEQFRPGPGRVTLEFPAGLVDPGEAAGAAAARELAEETGYRGAAPEVIGELDPNPALQNNRLYVVLIDGCAPAGDPEPDPGEVIRAREAGVEELESWIAAGVFGTAFGVAAWDCYRRYRSSSG